jgi:hypothetical protein
LTPNGAVPKASALVVGIERYGFGRPGQNKGREAHLAAEFAQWLRDKTVCLASRITLMVAYNEQDYEYDEQDLEDDALDNNYREPPTKLLTKLEEPYKDGPYKGEPGVTVVRNARIGDFDDWARHRHPAADDERFVLFWAGRGLADQSDPYKKIYLLAEDADDLRYLELGQLLDAVGSYAPRAHRVAFADACRGLPLGREKLKPTDGWSVPPGAYTPEGVDPFIVYAAAYGPTTDEYRKDEHGFTNKLLKCLVDYPTQSEAIFGKPSPKPPEAGQEPRKIFEEQLQWELFHLWRAQPGTPSWTIYRYQDPYRQPEPIDGRYPVPDASQLKAAEWASLLAEVRGKASPASNVLWNAYFYAAGPPPADGSRPGPGPLDRLADLMQALRDLPPGGDLPPPLVVGCDFVANLPVSDQYAGLNKWCRYWAAARNVNTQLQNAIANRPERLRDDRPYFSILVEPIPTGRHYRIGAVLWTADKPKWLDKSEHANVAEDRIRAVVEELVIRMKLPHAKSSPGGVVVEFVLPRRLLDWPRYNEIGDIIRPYPFVVRDWDRLQGQGLGKDKAEARWPGIKSFRPSWRESGASKIKWFECGPMPKQAQIETAADDDGIYCIALAIPEEPADDPNRGIPPSLYAAVHAGAPIVIWILQGGLDTEHPHGRKLGTTIDKIAVPSIEEQVKCAVPHIRKQIERGIRHSKKGFLDLPYLIHDLRRQFLPKDNPPQIGLLMEDIDRFWPGYFNWQSPGRPPVPVREGQ